MIKQREGSRLEVWSANYINFPDSRYEEDKKAVILQIEHSVADQYMVEVINLE